MSLINRSLGDLGVILLTRHILTSWWASMTLAAVGPTWDDLRLTTRSTWDGAKPWATKDQWSMNLAMVPGLKNWKMWFDDGWWLKISSSRFATSSARTQGIGQRGKKRPTWPNQSQLGSNLAVLGLGPNLRRTRASWHQLQLEPNWGNLGTFGQKLGWTCATWSCVEASGAQREPKLEPIGNVGLKLG